MKYPVRNATATRRLQVAALNGGINRRDAAHLIDDRQLSDADNVWWKDGRLQMRPAFQTNKAGLRVISQPLTVSADACSVHTCATGCIVNNHGVYGEYVAAIRHLSGTENGFAAEYAISLLLADGSRIDTDTLTVFDGDTQREHRGLMVVQGTNPYSGVGTHAFIEGGRVFTLANDFDKVTHAVRYYWTPAHPTIPTVMTAGRGFNPLSGSPKDAGGTVLRGLNRLCDRFYAQYTTDGESNVFLLPTDRATDALVSVKYTDASGEEHLWSLNSANGKISLNGKTITVSLGGNAVQFTENDAPFGLPDGGVANNLVLQVRLRDGADASLFGGTAHAWFGSAIGGLDGGTRWFFAQGSTLHWSAPTDPLDIPENNCAVVGNFSEPITAFGKQGDMLVVFKERSIHAVTYTAQTIDTDDVVSGEVVDMQASSALFPITQLHAFVGCDCPQTVALCDNRLVWATSQKRVYTLTAQTAFSECNVLEISDSIRPALLPVSAEGMKQAVGCDADGYYLLFADHLAAALHYGDGALVGLSGLSASKRRAFSWYRWSYPDTGMRFVCARVLGTQPVLLAECTAPDGTVRWATVTVGEGDDSRPTEDGEVETVPIAGFVQTKSFDFARPERLKRVQKWYADAPASCKWVWLTDDGEHEDHTNRGTAARTPHLPFTVRFGARVTFCGEFSLTGITAVYQVLDDRKR